MRKLHPEGFFHLLQRGLPGHAVGIVCQRKDVAVFFRDVELVFNLADDFFQHVFHGDQPGHFAELINQDAHVVAIAAEFAQQVVQPLGFRHK